MRVLSVLPLATATENEKTLVRHRTSLGMVLLAGAMVAAVQCSWFRRGAKGQLLPILLAAVPLTARAAEEQALCLNPLAVPPETAEDGDHYLMIWTMVVLMVGCVFGWWLRGRCERKPTKRDVKAQSQTTYSYYNAQPRFTPLAERDSGAWSEQPHVEWTW